MVIELPRRTSVSGPALVRLLSRLAQIDVVEPRQSPAARLDEWLGWTESILLSKVLNAAAPSSTQRPAQAAAGPANAADNDVVDVVELAQAEYAQVLASLEQAIAAAVAPPAAVPALQRRQFRGVPKAIGDVDFPSYRRRYSMVQQKMESSIVDLRARMRSLLASQSPQLARLAAVDAAMEQALAGHEQRLLMGVPRLLEGHFARLQQAQDTTTNSPEADGQTRSQHWLAGFRDDMAQVMRAELDLRMQPIQGLLSAIHASQA